MGNEINFLWEELIAGEPAGTLNQIIEFTEQLVFEENLIEAGFEPEEAFYVFVADTWLRFPPNIMPPSKEMEEATIYLD